MDGHDGKAARTLLLLWTQKHLRVGYQLGMQELLGDAAILLRASYEGSILLLYFRDRDDVALEWMNGKYISQQTARDAANPTHELADLYSLQSSIPHPNGWSAITWGAV